MSDPKSALEDPHCIQKCDEEQVRTPHQLAASEFLAHVCEIAGVRKVQADSAAADGMGYITVHVDSLRSEGAKRVFEMETAIRRKFHGSNFTVRMREVTPVKLPAD